MNNGCILLALLGLVAAQACFPQQRYWQNRSDGWFWYEIAPVLVDEPEVTPSFKPEVIPPADPEPIVPPEVLAHEKLSADLNQARSVAIMNPSFANIHSYLILQKEVMQRSSTFADVFQRVVWASPELDYQLGHRPLNSLGLRNWDAAKQNEQDELIAQAAKSQGLFFFFGPECIHCEQMASILDRIAWRHGIVVQAIATEGATHPSFPSAWSDNGFVAAARIGAVPALALANVDPSNPQIKVIGYGSMSQTQIEQRIAVLTGIKVGERF